MTAQDDSYKVILSSFEAEYEETHNPVWVWHAMDFCSTWQRKTGTSIPYPQWVLDYLSAVASTLLKLDDQSDDVSENIIEIIGIKKHSIAASIQTIRDKVIFLEIQSLVKTGMDSEEAIATTAKTFSLPLGTLRNIYQRFSR
jgi:hypothetical protein